MKMQRAVASIFAGAMLLSAAAFAAPQSDNGFAALRGLEVQTLSVEEMQAISGELNAYDIAAALTAAAADLAKFPRLQAAALKLAAFYTTNAVAINAAFAKFGILTSCKPTSTCGP